MTHNVDQLDTILKRQGPVRIGPFSCHPISFKNFYPVRIRARSWIKWPIKFFAKSKQNFRTDQDLWGGGGSTGISKNLFQIKPSWSSQLIDLRILMTKRWSKSNKITVARWNDMELSVDSYRVYWEMCDSKVHLKSDWVSLK